MTKFRLPFPLWLVVLTVTALLATTCVAGADQDEEGNDTIWFGESTPVADGAPSQSSGPGFWGSVRSLLGLGEARREPAAAAARPAAEPAGEPAPVKGDDAVPAEHASVPAGELHPAAATPGQGENAAEPAPAAAPPLSAPPLSAEAAAAPPRPETRPADRTAAAPRSTLSTVVRGESRGAEPSGWDNLLSAVGLSDGAPTPPPRELSGSPELYGQDYVVGPGDQLGISVWRDDMLTRTVLVLPDGKITYPLIGELVVGGKSLGEIKRELTEKLSSYVVEADISVEVKQSNSLFIYIIGRVNAPGRQMLVANTTVLQALAMAGGLNPFAQEDDIKVFRHEKEKTLVYKFRYSHVADGRHLEDNILLKRGDVIFVP